MSPNDHIGSLGEAAIERITVKGGIYGGAHNCTQCPPGTISSEKQDQCNLCPQGTTHNEDHTRCEPCGEGFYNEKEQGKCARCPQFTTSRRHAKDKQKFIDIDKEGEATIILDHAATHCEIESQLFI